MIHCGRRLCLCRKRLLKLYLTTPTTYQNKSFFIKYIEISKKTYRRCYDNNCLSDKKRLHNINRYISNNNKIIN